MVPSCGGIGMPGRPGGVPDRLLPGVMVQGDTAVRCEQTAFSVVGIGKRHSRQ